MLTITSVEQRQRYYIVTASDGQRYATKDMWIASLADQFRKKRTPVTLMSGSGWYYRELKHIEAVTEGATA